MRQLQRVAALAGLGAAVWPQNAEAWLAPNRRHGGPSGSFDAPISMVETQWGSPYTELPSIQVGETAFDFYLASLIAETPEIVEKQDEPADKEPFTCTVSSSTVDKNQSGVLQTVIGLEENKECSGFCSQVEGCVASIMEGATCSLLSNVRGLGKGSGTVMPKSCDESCFKRGRRFKGEGVSLGTAPNPFICQAMCQGADGCIGFSWDRTTSSCTSYKTEILTESAGSVTSGPRDPCSVERKPANYAGPLSIDGMSGNADNDSVTERLPSEAACRRVCLNDTKCNWFTYNNVDKLCYHKTTVGEIVVGKKGDSTSGRHADSSCYLKDTKFKEEPYKTVNKKYMQECVYQCTTEYRCLRWTYNTQKKTCQLFDQKGTASSEYHALNTWSGPKEGCGSEPVYQKHKTSPECSARGYRYAGVPLTAVTANTANTCQKNCQNTVGCEAFSFDFKGGVCYMYLAVSIKSKTMNSNFVSGPRKCSNCFTKGVQRNGTVIQELSQGFENDDECQLQCQATEGCAYFSYDGSKCKLLANAPTTEVNAVGSTGYKYCEGACDLMGYESPMKEYGYLKELANKTVTECRKSCKADPECSNFTSWNDKKCFLKSVESMRSIKPNNGATTGFIACPSCLRQGAGYTATDANRLWSLDTANAEECRWRCELMPTCTRFSYDILSKVCSLLSGEGETVEAGNLVSGPDTCSQPDISCFQKNVAFTGGKTIETVKASNATACQQLCSKNATCTYFTFASGKCTLQTGNDLTPKNTKGATAGPKKCFKLMSRCEEENIEYAGGDISSVSAENAEQCRQLCYQHPQCRVYTFNTDTKTCSIKTLEAIGGRKEATFKGVSGAKYGCSRWARGLYEYKGRTHKVIENIPHDTACQLQCEFSSKCTAFTYYSEKKTCVLHTAVRSATLNSKASLGPRTI